MASLGKASLIYFLSAWGDSNPHAFRHYILSVACLPIPPQADIISAVSESNRHLRLGKPIYCRCTNNAIRGSGWTRTTSPKRERFYRPFGYQLPVTLPLKTFYTASQVHASLLLLIRIPTQFVKRSE